MRAVARCLMGEARTRRYVGAHEALWTDPQCPAPGRDAPGRRLRRRHRSRPRPVHHGGDDRALRRALRQRALRLRPHLRGRGHHQLHRDAAGPAPVRLGRGAHRRGRRPGAANAHRRPVPEGRPGPAGLRGRHRPLHHRHRRHAHHPRGHRPRSALPGPALHHRRALRQEPRRRLHRRCAARRDGDVLELAVRLQVPAPRAGHARPAPRLPAPPRQHRLRRHRARRRDHVRGAQPRERRAGTPSIRARSRSCWTWRRCWPPRTWTATRP
jgi:hypothetical protein